MLFNSFEFLALFLPSALLIFYLVRLFKIQRFTVFALLLLSITFYVLHRGAFWYFLFLSIAWNFAIGRFILSSASAGRNPRSKRLMIIGIVGDLGALAYFKYSLFVESAIGLNPNMGLAKNVLPLGISFYTFTQIAFLVDVYQNKLKGFGARDYVLFVTYFPHLIAGPIIHHKDVIPQFQMLNTTSRLNADNFMLGSVLLSIGLFKKSVIADSLSPIVAVLFDSSSSQPAAGSDCWLGALAYAMQIYFDFSAYSDMALGISVLFGVELPINFNSPYKATSIIDFWRRWHISLSTFLRDYLYIPLGGNRSGEARKYANIFLTMLIGGLWHGAGFTFIAWGVIHGLLILLNHAWRAFSVAVPAFRGSEITRAASHMASWMLTFLAVLLAWVFFRSPDLATAGRIIRGMVSFSSGPFNLAAVQDWLTVMVACAIAWFGPNAYQITGWNPFGATSDAGSGIMSRWRTSPSYAIVFGAMFAIAMLFIQRRSEFLYWQF